MPVIIFIAFCLIIAIALIIWQLQESEETPTDHRYLAMELEMLKRDIMNLDVELSNHDVLLSDYQKRLEEINNRVSEMEEMYESDLHS